MFDEIRKQIVFDLPGHNLMVSGLVKAADIEHWRSFGVQTMICLEPEDEQSASQVESWKHSCEKNGVLLHFIPIAKPADVSAQNSEAFWEIVRSASSNSGDSGKDDKKILAFCATGGRTSTLMSYGFNLNGKNTR